MAHWNMFHIGGRGGDTPKLRCPPKQTVLNSGC